MGFKNFSISVNCFKTGAYVALLVLFMGIGKNAAAQCTAAFTFPDDTVCSDAPVPFTNASTGSGSLTHLWDFGDVASANNFSNQQNPTHSFSDTGLLTIKLIITDNTNCSDTLEKTIYVIQSPVANFTRYDNCKQTVTKFTNTSTWRSLDTISQWKWHFGNGDSSTAQHPQYTYPDTGTFQVKLIAKSSSGCFDTLTKSTRVYSKPNLTVSDTQFCAGTSVNFSVQVTETSGVTYNWRFGDGNASTQKSPVYTYNTGGYYHPRIKVTHNGTDSCFAQFDSLTVFGVPNVNFTIANDTLCFTGNSACVNDLSTPGNFGSGIKKRTIVFGDGFIDNTTPFATKIICHSYADPNGANYPISIELTDSNQCFASKQTTVAVVILPNYTPSFTVSEQKDCFKTLVTLTNTSTFDSSTLSSFTWIFGDASTATTGWDSKTHLYTTSGNFIIQLSITDTSGCTKTVSSSTAVQSFVLNYSPTVVNDTGCYQNNLFTMSNPTNLNAIAIWSFGDGSVDTGWSAFHRYNNPGRYPITLDIQGPNCDTTARVDTIVVLGPRARISSPQNRYQCMIHDTVYFTNNFAPYVSDHGPVPGNIKRIWDFGDAFAPQCTTDTKNGINITGNCNFSKDSMGAKHWYTPGTEGCFGAKLRLQDTVMGCLDTSVISIALQPPKAGPDLLSSPVVPGLLFNHPDCLGPEGYKAKILNLNNTQPACSREISWILWDSLCAQQSGNINGFWVVNDSFHNYLYDSPPCDTGGRVTVGLIIRNGQDTAGQFCYDTAWYHHVFQFNDLFPRVTDDFTPSASRCPGTTVNFRVTDTLQTGIVSYSWDFKDGTSIITGPTTKSVQHTFNTNGDFVVTLTIQNADGCIASDTSRVIIGFDGDISASATDICVGDTVFFTDSIFYYDIGLTNWITPSRQTAGKEKLSWDFGDGAGFTTNGNNPQKIFNKVGDYTIRLALKDSSGCLDTIVFPTTIKVRGAYARLITDDSIVCPQLFQLSDSSRIYDPLNYTSIPGTDSINNWIWTFNNGPKSFLKNPYFDFSAGGSYNIKLRVQNTTGCADSTTKNIFVKGPTPSFTFIGDSTGCSPLMVTFKNLTTNANRFTWNFRDANNNILTTFSDTDVYNVYVNGGSYKPFLMAESSEFDSKQGRVVTCKAIFPDTANQTKRIVTLQSAPTAAIANSNSCSSFTINFTDSSTIDAGTIVSRIWNFGDGDTSTQTNPTHAYADTGTYTITLITTGSTGCTDTAVKVIAVAPPPTAYFGVGNTCHQHVTQFTDSSITNNAYVVSWNWTFGDGSTSVFPNPTKIYGLTGTYNVKLKILTNAGCIDSLIKSVTINPLPVVSFTAPNTCLGNNIITTNTTTVTAGNTPLTYMWNLGSGGFTSTPSPTPIYSSAGPVDLTLVATSVFGCQDSAAKTVHINPNPITGLAINDTSQCINGNVFNFINQTSISVGGFTSTWAFGDGFGASSIHTTHTYSTPGTYNVIISSISDSGCRIDKSQLIYVFPKPVAGFTINDTALCLNTNNFVFTNASSDTGALTHQWDFGNTATSTLADPTNIYTADGQYIVQLIATNGNQCKDTIQDTVRVLPIPVPAFTIDDTGQCVNNNLFTFTNTSTNSAGTLTANWQFGDGTTSSTINSSHTYTIDSTYTVRLVSISNRGCSEDTTHTLTVFPKPFPDFVVNDSDQCLRNNLYSFINATAIKYGTNTYTWNFGDGNTSNGTHVNNSYATDSNFQVKLVALSNNLCADSITRQVTVFPHPSTSFTVNILKQCLNTNQFDFTGTSTIKYGSLTYLWNFDSGDVSTKKDTSIVYSYFGQIPVKLVTRSNFDCLDSITQQIEVYPVPVPAFTINDTDQCLKDNRFVISNGSFVANNWPLNFLWKWGNGDTSNIIQPGYTYPTDSSYDIRLVVTSSVGCKDSLQKPVIIFPQPQLAFTINDTGQCINGNSFDFTNQTTIKYGTLAYNWSFKNGETSIKKDTTVVFSNYGIYRPRLLATSDHNCWDSLVKDIRVYAKPTPLFTVNDSDQCLKGNSYSITNLSSILEGSITYKWDFGNGDTANAVHPVYSYPADTAYTIGVLVTSDFGCKDSVKHGVIVYPQPKPLFTINDSGQCVNDNLFAFTNLSTIKYGSNTYSWNFGDGQSSVNNNPSVKVNYDSVYRVVLRATTNFACTDTVGRYIVVHSKPNPAFTIDDTGQCVNNNLFKFTNISTIRKGTLISSQWNFGDGFTDGLTSPAHTYTYDSSYTVRLVSLSDSGCRDTATRTLTVFPKPTPKFVANDSDQCVNTNFYQYFNQSTIKYGTNTYSWNFGDGITSAIQGHPVHTYSADTNYQVKLLAVSNFDCRDSITKQVTVFPKPSPAFSINTLKQCLNTNKFDFTGTSTIKYGSLTYLWNFDSGDKSTKKDTSIVYTYFGLIPVKLVTRSNFDCLDSVTQQIEVYPVPVPVFTINDSDQCLKDNRFVISNGSFIPNNWPLTFKWKWGNGDTLIAVQPAYSYPKDSSYTIRMIVTSSVGCKDSLQRPVIVYPQPQMAFTINDTGQCVNGNKFDYTNQTTIKYGTLTYNWDFKNGVTTTKKDTSIVYAAFGKYRPRLLATTNHNCWDSLVKDVRVYAKPTPLFTVNDSDQCLTGNSFVLINQSTIGEGTVNYKWYFGNGDTANATNPVYSYPKDSSYTIRLVITSDFDCKDSIQTPVIVYPQPKIAFTINDSGQCVNNNLFAFTNTTTVKYGTMTYNWNFGDGQTATAKDTSLVYNYDSTFRAVLRATTNHGCTDTGGRYVIVHSKPTPDFTVNDTDQCVNTDLFLFTNATQIKQGTVTYQWDFANGLKDTATHPATAYNKDSTYSVKLLTTSDFNCVDSISKSLLVFPKPAAKYIVNDSTQCININNFVFTNQTTIKYGTLTHEWDFGNSNGSTIASPAYVYPIQGTYPVTLITKSDHDCFDTTASVAVIYPAPRPSFTIDDTAQCLKGNLFTFTSTSSIDSGSYNSRWKFSDGKQYDSINVTRSFSNPIQYSAKLVLVSDHLCTDSTEQTITVFPHPSPDFDGLKKFYCSDNPVLPLFPVVPGGTFTSINMVTDSFAPIRLGPDTVRYDIAVNGCPSDTVKYTTVHPLPVLNLTDTNLCRREFLLFDISFPNSTYMWQDGLDVPKYKVILPGIYKAILYNICDTLTRQINVTFREYDCNYFFPTAFTPNGDGINDVFIPWMEDVEKMKLQIYTRWGEKIFESNDFTKGWDGTYQGEAAQIDVYIWKVELEFNEKGFRYNHAASGNVSLVR